MSKSDADNLQTSYEVLTKDGQEMWMASMMFKGSFVAAYYKAVEFRRA